jgi:outer membrane cobalamin receptor
VLLGLLAPSFAHADSGGSQVPPATPHVAIDDLPPMPESVADDTIEDVAARATELFAVSVVRRVESVQESAAIVTVITRQTILERGYRNLGEILDDLPGFEGRRPGFALNGLSSSTFARGHGGTILVLWNGVPLNDPGGSGAAMLNAAYLPVRAIDRIEVMSGPSGVLWGANAFLGIVSITSLRHGTTPAALETEVLGGGGPGRQSAFGVSSSFAESLLGDRISLFGNLSYYTSRDAVLRQVYDVQFSPFPPPQPNGTHQLRVSSGPTVNARDHALPLTLAMDVGPVEVDCFIPLVDTRKDEFAYGMVRSDQFARPDGTIVATGSSGHRRVTAFASAALHLHIGPHSTWRSRAHYVAAGGEGKKIGLPAGAIGEEAIVTYSRPLGEIPLVRDTAGRLGVNTDLSYTGWPHHHLLGGGEMFLEYERAVEKETVGAFTAAPRLTSDSARRLVLTAYVNDRLRPGEAWLITAGARAQAAPGTYAPLFLGSAALAWNPSGAWFLKLNLAQGFRPPALDRFTTIDDPEGNPLPHIQANPDLRGERSSALEGEAAALLLKGTRRFQYLALRAGYQLTWLTDLIVERQGTAVNSARRVISSAEIKIDARLVGDHHVSAAYAFLAAYDRDVGPLRDIANQKIHLAGHFQMSPRLTFVLRATIYSRREDVNRLPLRVGDGTLVAPAGSVTIDRLPPVALLRASLLARSLWPGLADGYELALHVDNVLDARSFSPDEQGDDLLAPLPVETPGLSAILSLTGRL